MLLCQLIAVPSEINFPPQVSVQFSGANYEGQDIKGTIIVIHMLKQKIDESSFRMNGAPMKVEPMKTANERLSPGLVISRYSFTIPKKPAGLYQFPSIKVNVGGLEISSVPVSFEVIRAVSSNAFRLQALVQNIPPFYPGQKITVQYRIYFHEPIELIKEDLPLLYVPGLRGVGAPKVKTFVQGEDTVQVISQEIVAPMAGTFEVPPSHLMGYVYKEGSDGQPIRTSTLLKASAPGFSITVTPFPEVGKPSSFVGAIGLFHYQAHLLGSNRVLLGDMVKLEIIVSGQGDLDTVILPNIKQQKGFQDFRFNGIPSIGKVENNEKRFVVELRPITTAIKDIPPIEFSSFDPLSKSYVVGHTAAIALTVRSNGQQPIVPVQENVPAKTEICENRPLLSTDFEDHAIDPTAIFFAIAALIVALVSQFLLKKFLQIGTPKEVRSRDLFYNALRLKTKPSQCVPLIQQALLLRLYEVGYTSQITYVPQELSKEGLQGEVRRFLESIEQKRFTGLELDTEMKEIIKEASELYYRLGVMKK